MNYELSTVRRHPCRGAMSEGSGYITNEEDRAGQTKFKLAEKRDGG